MKYIVTSDIHLGHKRTPTSHIIKSFKTAVLCDSNKDADALFIGGDLFDRLLEFNIEDVKEVIGFFHYLLDWCYDNDVQLRVLEGTPSHDWQQSSLLLKFNEVRKKKVDLRYFKVLDIEYNERLKKHILYIPDEWTADHKQLEKDIQKKLDLHGITQVDMALLHGLFQYQIGGIKVKFCFDENYFLKLVKGFIHIGHFHIFSNYDRIIANGSLDRLAFGEDQPKGYVVVEDDKFRFIENPNAAIYKTYKVSSDKGLDRAIKMASKLPIGSYVRFVHSPDMDIDKADVCYKLLDYNVSFKANNKQDINVVLHAEEESFELDFEGFTLEKVKDYLLENVQAKNSLTERQKNILEELVSVIR